MSIRQGNGDGLGVGVEDGENLSLRLVDTERHTVFIFTVHRVDTALNILPCGQMKCRVGFPERNQALVVAENILIFRLVQSRPFQGIDAVRGAVAVVVKAAVLPGLGAEHFLTGLQEGDALREHIKRGGEVVHPNPGFNGRIRGGEGDTVKESGIVVAGGVIHTLVWLSRPGRHSHEAGFQRLFGYDCAGDEARRGAFKGSPAKQVADGVAEEAEAGNHRGIGLYRQPDTGLGQLGLHIPALTVENHVGVLLMDGGHDLVDGHGVDQAGDIEAEAVHVVFVRPVADGIHDVLAHHAPLGSGVVAAEGSVGVFAATADTAEIAGDDLVDAERPCVIHVVVYYVHDHTQAVVVERLDHLLHLRHTDSAVKRVGGIRPFGDVVIHRVVAPVVLGTAAALVGEAEVIHRQEVDMGDAQRLDVVKTGGMAAPGLCAGFGQTQKLALVLNMGAGGRGQVADVQLVNYGVGDGLTGVGVCIGVPLRGIDGSQVQNHPPAAVDAGGSCIGVADLPGLAVHSDEVSVVNAVQISEPFRRPCAADVGLHPKLGKKVVGTRVAAAVQADGNRPGSGRPQAESRLFRRPECA